MNRCQMQLWAPLAALCLSACNTSDALTPKVDVGGGLFPSSPVSQQEAQQLARSDGGSFNRRAYYPPPPQPARTGAQNRMEAQNRALSGRDAPIASAPLSPPPASQPAAQPTPAQQPVETATVSGNDTIRFLPIIGAPVEAVTPLSRQLGNSARAGGLTIRSSTDVSASHILKGYLSAFEDGSKVTVVYVWDVLDPAGSRLNRIQGQLSTPARGGDPWASVPAELMQTIGQKTISDYLEWRNRKTG
ncbi:hypothetical protein ACFSE1_16600 [Rhizobium helianthi]|uniref:Lipoprotein n=1 Tax=Rhizobium helianthi TaxID=1132695 RepID=A0ABW4M702_9HYPH